MNCDLVRDQLAEHLLGTVSPEEDLAVRGHVRGCGQCRRELGMLEEGLSTFAQAAHQATPPEQLRERVLTVLEEERADRPAPVRRFTPVLVLQAAVVVLLAGALAWGSLATIHAGHLSSQAGRYKSFLTALGGRDVRVGTLQPGGTRAVEGSAILYDSDVGQSWALVLVRAPGLSGQARVILTSSSSDRNIELHPLVFSTDGEASSWLVTPADISRFDRLKVITSDGRVLARGHIAAG
ncbi:MAG: zf-HC2 domain-containing protein [Actinomycetota bacterium]|nr:zf-HC2 domain-containing protein [Actinomycetota bacterium]